MKNIAITSVDKALDSALNFLFQDQFNVVPIELNERLASYWRNYSIDLLIIDLNAIDVDNINMLGLLKKIHNNLPIIILYDLKIPENLKYDLYQFADAMFRKPFNNDQIKSAVHSFLKTKNSNMN